jgi:hypothetical protein
MATGQIQILAVIVIIVVALVIISAASAKTVNYDAHVNVAGNKATVSLTLRADSPVPDNLYVHLTIDELGILSGAQERKLQQLYTTGTKTIYSDSLDQTDKDPSREYFVTTERGVREFDLQIEVFSEYQGRKELQHNETVQVRP